MLETRVALLPLPVGVRFVWSLENLGGAQSPWLPLMVVQWDLLLGCKLVGSTLDWADLVSAEIKGLLKALVPADVIPLVLTYRIIPFRMPPTIVST